MENTKSKNVLPDYALRCISLTDPEFIEATMDIIKNNSDPEAADIERMREEQKHGKVHVTAECNFSD